MTTAEERARTLWLMVSTDKYELPLIVEDSAAKLARRAGVNVTTVMTSACNAERTGKWAKYIRVIFDTKEELAICD